MELKSSIPLLVFESVELWLLSTAPVVVRRECHRVVVVVVVERPTATDTRRVRVFSPADPRVCGYEVGPDPESDEEAREILNDVV